MPAFATASDSTFRLGGDFCEVRKGDVLVAGAGRELRRAGYVAASDPEAFAAVWEKARTETVRIAMFGDSQESSPGGSGLDYHPRLNFNLRQRFGKVGESIIYGPGGNFGSGSPPAAWLATGATSGQVNSALATNARLPGIAGPTQYASTANGMVVRLNPTNDETSAGAQIRGIPVWSTSHAIYATLFGRQFDGSDDGLAWSANPTNSSTSFFGNPATASGTLSLGLNSASGEYRSGEIGPLPWGGRTKQQVIVRGTSAARAEYAGIRFRNADTPGGVSVQSFSSGGYQTTSVLASHANAGPMLLAFGPWDAIALHFGANDAFSGGGVSANNFKTNVLALIEAIRGANWLNNATQKFILFSDPYRTGGTSGQYAEFENYYAKCAEIAAEDGNVMAVNGQKWVADRFGWNAANGAQYLSDGVHYSGLGARVLAGADAYLMVSGTT